MTNCKAETFTAKATKKEYYLQRNAATNAAAFELAADVKDFFNSPSEALCAIKEWYLSSTASTSKLPSSDALAIKFNQQSRSVVMGPLTVKLSETASEDTKTYTVNI
jgi:hypothetical protein